MYIVIDRSPNTLPCYLLGRLMVEPRRALARMTLHQIAGDGLPEPRLVSSTIALRVHFVVRCHIIHVDFIRPNADYWAILFVPAAILEQELSRMWEYVVVELIVVC